LHGLLYGELSDGVGGCGRDTAGGRGGGVETVAGC
jgi:hypothetical protein